MCFAEIGEVLARDADEALVRTRRGRMRVSVLLAPDLAVGDHVTMHSGHVVEVLTPDEADEAAALRGVPDGTTSIGVARTEG